MKQIKFAVILLLGLYGCEKFEYSPYQVSPKSEYKNINQKNIARFIQEKTDTVRIAVIVDSQRFYSATEKIVDKINKLDNINFVVHTGDLVDFGVQREYTWMHKVLSKLNNPYVGVIGNHDLIGNGNKIYEQMYGDLNFSFTFNGNKFVFINTNGREFGFDPKVPDISWLANELADTLNYQNAIIVNHVQPYNNDFNPLLKKPFVETLGRYGKVLMCINGHHHDFNFFEPFNDGIPYLNSFSTSKEKFVVVKIWDNDFSIEIKE